MSIPFEWEWIERHKDFIANMLDLVSFMLVTPEILIRVKPEFGAIQRFLFSSAFFLITSYLLATLLAAIGITTARSFYYVGVIAGDGAIARSVQGLLRLVVTGGLRAIRLFARPRTVLRLCAQIGLLLGDFAGSITPTFHVRAVAV
jgi:hypothetical protein